MVAQQPASTLPPTTTSTIPPSIEKAPPPTMVAQQPTSTLPPTTTSTIPPSIEKAPPPTMVTQQPTSTIPPPIEKARHIVKPAEPTPNHPMYLSGCDQIAAVTHTPTVYFYKPTTTSLSEAVQILKESLTKALVIFYPIAGRVNWSEKGRVELNCNGEGVLLVEAESEATVEDYGDFIPTPEIRALIPTINLSITPIHELPLCTFQITKFRCGGFCLGVGISHSVGDGQSCLHFISEWCKIARGETDKVNTPFVDRSLLQTIETMAKPIFEHPEFDSPPLLVGKTDNLEERKKPTTVTMFKITKEQIEKLKNRANEDKASNDARGYSRFEGLGGHVWRSACKARGLVPEQKTRLDVPADIRNRMIPPLPEKYFGNTIIRAAAFATVGDLLEKPLSYAASRLRETSENLTDEYIRSYLAFIKNVPDVSKYRNFHTVGCALGGFYGNPNLESTSWMGLPMFGADFGWGKEIHMGPGAVGFDGKFFILPTRDGDGSFNLLIRLQVEHMDAFKKFFYEDM